MIRAGIIGFGYMGHFHWNKMKQREDRILPVAVYDTDEGKRNEASAEGMTPYDSLEEFLASDIDLVIISTPNQWHVSGRPGRFSPCITRGVTTVIFRWCLR